MGIASDGSYGIPEGIVFGVPAICANGSYEVVKGLEMDAYAQSMLDITLKELLDERAGVASIVG